MLDLANEPMGLYGALSALVVFGIFIGTWWYYGMRVHGARQMIDTGMAVLVNVDRAEEFAAAQIEGARNIPLEEIESRVWELGSRRRPIVLCGAHAIRSHRAASRLRDLGFHVINLGSVTSARTT